MAVTLKEMRTLLGRAYSSINENKLNGIYAEIDFFNYIVSLGYADRVSPGGWILRPKRVERFGTGNIAVFPEIIQPGKNYPIGRKPPAVPPAIERAAGKLGDAHMATYFCFPEEAEEEIVWVGMERGVPSPPEPEDVRELISPPFIKRDRRYNYLRYKSDVSKLKNDAVPSLYSLESLRVFIENRYYCETHDLDRLLWGKNTIYPVEVKEKTRVTGDKDIGDWFGLDVGPYTKLAYFAAWYRELKSLFVVREITDVQTRKLRQWWAIEFSDVAKYASWVFRSGGRSMKGTASAVVKIPVSAFTPLDAGYLASL